MTDGDTFPAMPVAPSRPVGRWLALWSAMLVALVVIGGVTRLTESGLSITEWKPVTGVIPPLGEAAWEAEFAKYQQIPEFRLVHASMTLADFRRIYFWEYLHRLWARLLGLAFALPLLYFVARGQVRGPLAWRLGVLLALFAAQGFLGWYMVSSGLVDRTDVSQYRLAAHLALALVLYGAAVWSAADQLAPGAAGEGDARYARLGALFAGYVFLTIVAGAFTAGLDAGKAWNTFPLMGGDLLPPGYGALAPWWRNVTENAAAVQFHHRWLGGGGAVLAVGVWLRGRDAAIPERARVLASLVAGMAGLQVLLGISTLLLAVPVPVAALHQLGAVALLTLALLLTHASRPRPAA